MSNINITNETRMVIEQYLAKQQNRRQKRDEKKASLGKPKKKTLKPRKENVITVPESDIRKINRYIVNLQKIAASLEERRTPGGLLMFIAEPYQNNVDNAISKISEALNELKGIR